MVSIGEVIDGITKSLPVPKTLFEGTWTFVGWMAGYAFGAQCDEDLIKYIDEMDGGKYKKWILKCMVKTLNFLHHSWIGLLGVIYFGLAPVVQSVLLPVYIPVVPCAEAFWFCLGMAVEDLQYHIRASATDGNLSTLFRGLKTKSP